MEKSFSYYLMFILWNVSTIYLINWKAYGIIFYLYAVTIAYNAAICYSIYIYFIIEIYAPKIRGNEGSSNVLIY